MNDESPYTNREMREFFREFKQDLLEIKEQTTKTNGRVTKGEERLGSLENYRHFVMGGLAVICILLIPILIQVVAKKI